MSTESTPAATSARGGTATARRRQREAEIISATRQLFDERGVRDAQIEDIANAVGINRAIIYRHFTGKEELFSLTLVQYLDELRVALEDAAATTTALFLRPNAAANSCSRARLARPSCGGAATRTLRAWSSHPTISSLAARGTTFTAITVKRPILLRKATEEALLDSAFDAIMRAYGTP